MEEVPITVRAVVKELRRLAEAGRSNEMDKKPVMRGVKQQPSLISCLRWEKPGRFEKMVFHQSYHKNP